MRVGLLLATQALLWLVIALAFAALVERAGWVSWPDALVFAASSWLPWIVLTPAVFWLAWRFPFERGHLWRAIPVHLVACTVVCIALTWVSSYFAPWPRGRFPPREQRVIIREGPPPARVGEKGLPERMPPEPGPAGPRERAKGFAGPGFGKGPGPGGDRLLGRFWPPFSTMMLRSNVSVAIYAIVVCFAHAFAYYRRAQDREREAMALAAGLSRAKLDALRLQLQPHFLFNTLNAISTLVHRDPNAADELIGDLSELLRLSLQTSEHEVPLARELELLDCYLAIERTRLGERLKIVREIDPHALPALVPTFVLQPLAENAVRHGIEPRRAPGTITLRADVVGENVRLVVADDGVGLKAPMERGGGRRGIGIANTEERLRALHGAAAHLDIVAPESGGVQVQVVLPFRTTAATATAASNATAGAS